MEVSLFNKVSEKCENLWQVDGGDTVPPVCFPIAGMNADVFMETSEKVEDAECQFWECKKELRSQKSVQT